MDISVIGKLGDVQQLALNIYGRTAIMHHPDFDVVIVVVRASADMGTSVNVSRTDLTGNIRPGFNTYDGSPEIVLRDALNFGVGPIGQIAVPSLDEFVRTFMEVGLIPSVV